MSSPWRELAARPPRAEDPPLLLLHGNCQAESLRVLLASALGDAVASVRLPPVFELGADDIDDLRALLRRTTYLVSQPIAPDYRGLPLGSAQVAALLPPSGRVALVPVLRWAALCPTHAIVRAPGVGEPPAVPYHDLRTLAAAARGRAVVDLAEPSATAVRAIRDLSAEQLRVRQEHHGTVDALSVLRAAGAEATWTLNHPQNVVLRGVASLALERLGLPGSVEDPGRVLLSATTAPLSASTLAALGLTGTPRDGWRHQGVALSEEEVARAQLAWYAEHPAVVTAGLRRHADALEALGLA